MKHVGVSAVFQASLGACEYRQTSDIVLTSDQGCDDTLGTSSENHHGFIMW
jgi:hypothetical protein